MRIKLSLLINGSAAVLCLYTKDKASHVFGGMNIAIILFALFEDRYKICMSLYAWINKVLMWMPAWVWLVNIYISLCVLAVADTMNYYLQGSYWYWRNNMHEHNAGLIKLAGILHNYSCKKTGTVKRIGVIPAVVLMTHFKRSGDMNKSRLYLFTIITLLLDEYYIDRPFDQLTYYEKMLVKFIYRLTIDQIVDVAIKLLNAHCKNKLSGYRRLVKIIKKHPRLVDALDDDYKVKFQVCVANIKQLIKGTEDMLMNKATESANNETMMNKLAIQYKQAHKTNIYDTCEICMTNKELYRYDCVVHMFCIKCSVTHIAKREPHETMAGCPLCAVPYNQYYKPLLDNEKGRRLLIKAVDGPAIASS